MRKHIVDTRTFWDFLEAKCSNALIGRYSQTSLYRRSIQRQIRYTDNLTITETLSQEVKVNQKLCMNINIQN